MTEISNLAEGDITPGVRRNGRSPHPLKTSGWPLAMTSLGQGLPSTSSKEGPIGPELVFRVG